MVGVLGLSTDLLTASFTSTLEVLRGAKPKSEPCGRAWHSARVAIEDAISNSGPAGWLEWVLAYRNMYVHRARRLMPSSLKPRPTVLLADGRSIFHTELVRILPRDPQWSEAQAWRDPERASWLTENAKTTLSEAKDCSAKLIEGTAAVLVEVWRQRRDDPSVIPQPIAEWSNLGLPKPSVFVGFKPGTQVFSPGLIAAGGDTIQRLRSANVMDEHRDQRWPKS